MYSSQAVYQYVDSKKQQNKSRNKKKEKQWRVGWDGMGALFCSCFPPWSPCVTMKHTFVNLLFLSSFSCTACLSPNGNSMLIPLIFWALMRKYQRPHTGVYEWATVSEHTTNVVFMALEMVLTRMTMDVRHIVFTLGFVLLYLLMAFVDHWINGTWVYSALDYEKMGWTKVGLFYVIVAVGMTAVYLILWKLHQIKERRGIERLQRRLQVQLENDIESASSSQEPSKKSEL